MPWEEEEYRWNESWRVLQDPAYKRESTVTTDTTTLREKLVEMNSDHGRRGHILVFIANQPITFSCGNNMFGSFKIIFVIIFM